MRIKDFPVSTFKMQYSFCAAHIVKDDHECNRMHGHTYQVTVYYAAFNLNVTGKVLGQEISDQIMLPLIESLHGKFIVSRNNIIDQCLYVSPAMQLGDAIVAQIDQSTLAELARWLYKLIKERLHVDQVYLSSVELSDRPNRSLTYQGLGL